MSLPIVEIESTILNKINFACYQCSFAILRELSLRNASDKDIFDIRLSVSSSPGFIKSKTWQIDRLSVGEQLNIKDRELELDGGFLLALTEATKADVYFTVISDGEVLLEHQEKVELLACNEWGGNSAMPELLAAFCTPNSPLVDRLLGEASKLLRAKGKPDEIDGYISASRERVWEMASAIYAAISNMKLGYALPPASFEANGQKIRLPGAIEQSGVATCLDTTLLFAACFEQAGLNPIVILTEGHAMVGLWLEPEDLASIMTTDGEILRQRIPLHELIVIETTLVTKYPPLSFSQALETGKKKLSLENEKEFVAAVDIRRARGHRITPLSIASENSTISASGARLEDAVVDVVVEDAPVLPSSSSFIGGELVEESPSGRLDRWQRKLLDLSARNPLLNHRISKSSLKFYGIDPAQLEDMLAANAEFSIGTFPKLKEEQDGELYADKNGSEIKQQYAINALAKHQLLVDMSSEDLDKAAVSIYRKSRTSLQEGGANTLYIAVGFLMWKQKETDDKRYRAPLILIPVELIRKSVRSGVKLKASEEEPRFNTTLIELLKKDFGIEISGLSGSLPTDDSGVDVPGIWNHVREAIKNIPGFEVVEEVVLGNFSFAKYLMWKDLVDREENLRESPIVRHLLDTPREAYESSVKFVDKADVDREFAPADLLTPLPADASQMAAIATADRGKDFVIIGPPGTGKSQTIGNLIAHMMGKGKKVLFVSEKTAALEVVHRRLKDLGLGRFCLELHSNKAKKLDVLNQLRDSWAQTAESTATKWQAEANRLRVLRDSLNGLVNALHTRYPNGLTPHYAIGVKVRDEALANKVSLNWRNSQVHDAEKLELLRETARLLQVQAMSVGSVTGHPLEFVESTDWSPNWQDGLSDKVAALSATAAATKEALSSLEKALKLDFGDASYRKIEALGEFCEALLASYRQQSSFSLEPDGADRLEALEEVVDLLKDYIAAQSRLSCPYSPLAWKKVDVSALRVMWNDSENFWWFKRWLTRRKVIKQLKIAGANGKPNVVSDLNIIEHLRKTGESIDNVEGLLNTLKGWSSYDTDPEVMNSIKTIGSRVRSSVSKLADDAESLAELRSKIRTLIYDANDMLAKDAPVGRAMTDYRVRLMQFMDAKRAFEKEAGNALFQRLIDKGNALDSVISECQKLNKYSSSLREWCAWIKRRKQAQDLNLGPLVKGIESGVVEVNEIVDVFEAAYCAWWSAAVISENDILRSFSSAEHEAAIIRFRETDDSYRELTSRYIAAKLAGDIPDQEDTDKKSSWGVLRHELQKKTRHKPVRDMMNSIPDVITTLAPCLMMSPLSIAQFLSTDQTMFDVVIFDEASQITVWDAVGALARGKQVIVAGDPKQMPPTNFFGRSSNDDDIDDEGDLESILDELLGASIPQRVLNLHYRSRRESLIAFSNNRYYDDSLVTFPAPVYPDKGVSFVKCGGVYSKGKGRNNPEEARQVVREIVERLTSTVDEVRNQSIGVVTFNSEQQSLIEDLLDKERREDPGLEWAFAEDHLEPVFVKNLESVQGDERDVILFSTTYGPDQSGSLSMNFGPLNKNGGERRLNVAMTRARSEMKVFSSLPIDRMDLRRTSARAVADLKHFLEYAERGPQALGAAIHGSKGDFESPFEVAVARELQNKGWEVHPQIGVSSYRIDLGILHPELPGVYLAGVECDGAMYHSSANARERDKVRQQVLEGLGWNIVRVWSTDWWINKEEQTSMIDKQLRELLDTYRSRSEDSDEELAENESSSSYES